MSVEPHTTGKRWYRPRNITIVAVLSFIGWLAYLVIWAVTVKPNASVDYAAQVQALCDAAQPQGEDGWALILEAADLLRDIEDSFDQNALPAEHEGRIDYRVKRVPNCSPEAAAVATQALNQVRRSGAFEKLAVAAQRPRAVRPISNPSGESLIMIQLPELALLRKLGSARAASISASVESGDFDDAVAALDQTLFLANVCSRHAFLIYQLVGYSIANAALEELRGSMTSHEPKAAVLRRLLAVLDNRTPFGPIEIGFEGERRSLLDMIQRTHSDNGRGDGTLLLAADESAELASIVGSSMGTGATLRAIANIGGMVYASRRDTTQKANHFFDGIVRQSRMSRQARQSDPFDESAFLFGLGWRYRLLAIMTPAVAKAMQTADMIACETAGTRVMLAIETYKLEQGQYPPNLQALVPAVLDNLPADPFSATGLVYRLVADDPLGRAYLLYSVSADGKDNDGRRADKPYDAFRSQQVTSAGFDFVFNRSIGAK
jgi:hypothetical protein